MLNLHLKHTRLTSIYNFVTHAAQSEKKIGKWVSNRLLKNLLKKWEQIGTGHSITMLSYVK